MYHCFRFHIWLISNDDCLFLSDSLHLVWSSLGPSMLLQMALFQSFLWLSDSIMYMYHLFFISLSSMNIYGDSLKKKTKNRATIWSRNPLLGMYPEKTIIQNDIHTKVPCSTVYNSQYMNGNSFSFHDLDVKTVD